MILFLTGCTALFSGVFGQDVPALIASIPPAARIYHLPLVATGQRFLVAQGIGGHFSHTGAGAYAIDFAMPIGTPVRAARDGVVRAVKTDAEDHDLPLEMREANFVSILHDDGQVSVYAHLDSACVQTGQRVRQGEVIGKSGNTGYSTQPHLHFHVEEGGRTIPFAFLDVKDPFGIPRAGQFYP